MGDNFIRFYRHPAVIVTLLDQKSSFVWASETYYVRVLSIDDLKNVTTPNGPTTVRLTEPTPAILPHLYKEVH